MQVLIRQALALVLTATVACRGDREPRRRPEQVPYLGTDSMGVTAVQVKSIRTRARRTLVENSAAAMSATQPGIIFTINDSGHDPLLFALDTTGADRGAWRLRGATNRDWEAASLGPCGEARGGEPTAGRPRCVYIGDVGNAGESATRTIYRVAEPTARDGRFTGEIASERVVYMYARGNPDVEAMYVAPNGTIYLVAKRALRDSAGRRRPVLIFTLPPAVWRQRDSIAVAQLIDSLPIVLGSAPGRTFTDASLSPDSRWVAVRTYLQVYVFAADSATGRIRTAIAPAVCNVVELAEEQGEGITWYGSTGRLLLTSEGRGEPMHIVGCPKPSN